MHKKKKIHEEPKARRSAPHNPHQYTGGLDKKLSVRSVLRNWETARRDKGRNLLQTPRPHAAEPRGVPGRPSNGRADRFRRAAQNPQKPSIGRGTVFIEGGHTVVSMTAVAHAS